MWYALAEIWFRIAVTLFVFMLGFRCGAMAEREIGPATKAPFFVDTMASIGTCALWPISIFWLIGSVIVEISKESRSRRAAQ